MKAANILETIGQTPHVRINRLFDRRVEVWMKLERANPGGPRCQASCRVARME